MPVSPITIPNLPTATSVQATDLLIVAHDMGGGNFEAQHAPCSLVLADLFGTMATQDASAVAITGGDIDVDGQLSATKSTNAPAQINATNFSNGAAATAEFNAIVEGTAGDAIVRVGVNGGNVFTSGYDVSTGLYSFSNSNTLGTGNIYTVDPSTGAFDFLSPVSFATAIAIASGGTGASTAAAARTNLGLGNAAVKTVSDNTKSVVASVSGATQASHLVIFNDTAGTVTDGGFGITGWTGAGNVVLSSSPTLVTPNIGAATGISVSITGTYSSTVATGTAPLTVSSTTRVANLNVATAGNADTVTTNANLTGPITSTGNATTVASQTGTGTKFVMDTAPTLVTPNIGAATGTSLSVSGQLASTVVTGTAPLAVSSTTRVSNLNAATCGNADTVTTNANLTGPITSTGNATSIASQTGTGTKLVVDTSPTLITPVLGVATATSLTFSGANQSALSAYETVNATLTLATGFTTTPTLTGKFQRIGNIVFMTLPSTLATISGTPATFTVTGMPARFYPTAGTQWGFISGQSAAGAFNSLGCNVTTGGVFTVYPTPTYTGTFANGATAGFSMATYIWSIV